VHGNSNAPVRGRNSEAYALHFAVKIPPYYHIWCIRGPLGTSCGTGNSNINAWPTAKNGNGIMKIRARFHGVLNEWVTEETADFDLGPAPTYADLLKDIGNRFGDDMPPELWDKRESKFHKSVLAVGDGRNLVMESALESDEEITFYLMLAGG